MKSLLLFSAGKESIYCLHEASPDLLLMFNYGQQAYRKERESIDYYASKFGIPRVVLDVPPALLNLPAGMRGGVLGSHVVMRNVVFLSLAANYAVTNGYNELLVGAASTGNYTDGDTAFVRDLDTMFQKLYSLEVHAPSGKLDSSKISALLMNGKYDLEKFWSCDSNGENSDTTWGHCGICEKCRGYLTEYANYDHPTRRQTAFINRFYRRFL